MSNAGNGKIGLRAVVAIGVGGDDRGRLPAG